eukprot:scaffold288_cov97-Cylindrotheca_fusiformis.AAC.8
MPIDKIELTPLGQTDLDEASWRRCGKRTKDDPLVEGHFFPGFDLGLLVVRQSRRSARSWAL